MDEVRLVRQGANRSCLISDDCQLVNLQPVKLKTLLDSMVALVKCDMHSTLTTELSATCVSE